MLALAAAALTLSVAVHQTDSNPPGTCVDVTIDGTTVADSLCPVPDALAVRTILAKGHTVYFGVSRAPLTLTFRRRTVRAPAGPYAVAVRGTPALGTIRSGRRHRVVDVFGLPGRQATVLRLTDEAGRRVRLRAAAPTGRPLCTGLQLAPSSSPGRVLCRTGPTAFQLRFSADCRRDRQFVYGIAPSRIARATAVLAGGGTAPVTVTRVPRSVRRRGVVLTARLTGALATRVRGYDAAGTLLASASLDPGCSSKTRSKIR